MAGYPRQLLGKAIQMFTKTDPSSLRELKIFLKFSRLLSFNWWALGISKIWTYGF